MLLFNRSTIATLVFVFSILHAAAQRKVYYDLVVADTIVKVAGKEKRAIAVNGQIPMPQLEFTEGDTAVVRVHNSLSENTSLHWHGVWLPNKEDGVPHLTQQPIAPGTTHTYTFPIMQNGTYWYHSHSGLQEQIGMYGNMVFHKRPTDATFRKGIDDLPSISLMLSEWTNMSPHTVDRLLHTGNDWFSIKKNTVQSYAEAVKTGHLKTKLRNEWKRMEAMDVSDVYYDSFLINGAAEQQIALQGKGIKVRVRIANGGASTYFWITFAGQKFTVVANDGNDVEPVEVDRLIVGVSESYDIVVQLPDADMAYELLATAEDRTGSASVFLGSGVRQLAVRLPRLHYFEGMKMMNDMMKMNGEMNDMGMDMSLQQMDMNAVMYPELGQAGHDTPDSVQHQAGHSHEHGSHSRKGDLVTLNYGMLKATRKTKLSDSLPVKELRFELTGNMSRYVWSMDNRVLSESDKIPVQKGEVLRITLYNNSMMRHPMHLHGFDFRVINAQADYAPEKNVLDIMPMETNVIEFAADRDGDWFFHCHILYHMMAGMNRVFQVGQYDNPLLPDSGKAYKKLQMESNMWHFMADNDFATNGNDGAAMLQNSRWSVGTEWRLGYNAMHGYEVETHVGRYIGKMQWLMPFVGFDWRYRKMGIDQHESSLFGQRNNKDGRAALSLGVMYTLPLLINLQTEVYHDGIVRLALMREDIPVSRRLRAGFMVNTDREYLVDLRYILHKNMGIRSHYDSDMGFGVGIALNY